MSEQKYYLPEPSYWPFIGSIGLFTTLFGFGHALVFSKDGGVGNLTMMYIGLAIIAFMMFGWFGTVIRESEAGRYNAQVDTTFRMAMMWFIFSEVMFFAAFFGALFYARQLSVPWRHLVLMIWHCEQLKHHALILDCQPYLLLPCAQLKHQQ